MLERWNYIYLLVYALKMYYKKTVQRHTKNFRLRVNTDSGWLNVFKSTFYVPIRPKHIYSHTYVSIHTCTYNIKYPLFDYIVVLSCTEQHSQKFWQHSKKICVTGYGRQPPTLLSPSVYATVRKTEWSRDTFAGVVGEQIERRIGRNWSRVAERGDVGGHVTPGTVLAEST